MLYRTTPHATTGQCPATVFFGHGIKNDIPEYNKDEPQDTELDRKDREKKEKMKEYADGKRNAKDSEIQEQDKVLVKNLWKNDKLSPNWLNEKFKVIKVYRKSTLLENERGNRYYRNKAHLKKYYENETNKHTVIQKDNTNQEEEITELPIDNANTQPVASPTRSERRPNITNANDANSNPISNENNNNRLHENDNSNIQGSSGNSLNEENIEDHLNEENNEDSQENLCDGTPVFVPDTVPTAIQEEVQAKRLPVRRHRKKKK